MVLTPCADPEGGTRGPDSPEKSGFLARLILDSLKNHKAAKQPFNNGPSLARGETPFKWRFA